VSRIFRENRSQNLGVEKTDQLLFLPNRNTKPRKIKKNQVLSLVDHFNITGYKMDKSKRFRNKQKIYSIQFSINAYKERRG
jgi:hypothetical protein